MADVYVVFAKTNKGMTAFIVERTCEGVSIGLEEKKMGIKGSSTATLIFRRCRNPCRKCFRGSWKRASRSS